MDISNFLIKLLFQQEKVAIEGFGVFSKKEQTAYIHPVTSTFSPSQFEIKFEQDATCVDNGLNNAIASELHISSEESKFKIQNWLDEVKSDLKAGKKFTIKNLGHLVPHHGNTVLFEVDLSFNFNADSFGLKTFNSKPIPTIEPASQPLQPKVQVKQRSYKWLKYSIAALIAVLILSFGFFYKDMIVGFIVKENNDQESKIDSIEILKSQIEENTSIQQNAQLDSAIQMEEVIDQNIAKSETNSIVRTAELQPYLVIAGCFKSEENASNYAETLKTKGYELAAVCGQTSGLYRVCYASFSNQAEANNFLTEIVAKGVKGSWVQFDESLSK